MQKFRRYLPITKVDDEQRMVYGFASTPDLDSDGEIITLKAITDALPAYLQFPTIREMHQSKAAGTTKEAEIRDGKDGKGLYIGAKVVADEAWKLVKEGVYKGFSIGGHVTKRIKNIIHGLELVEISLVDVPANKAAKIEVWKNKKYNIQKDGQGVLVFADLMSHIAACIEYCEYMGKDTKKLKKMLEAVKGLVAMEATEAEEEKAQAVSYLKSRISFLENTTFDDPRANLIREGVIMAMKDKADELDKRDETEAGKTPENSEADADKAEAKAGEGPVAGKEAEDKISEDKLEDDSKEDDSNKESAETPTLKKLDEINKTLEKINPTVEKEKLDITKSVTAMAGTLAKLADTLTAINERVSKLEKTPAAIKSRAAYVDKAIEGTEEKSDKKEDKNESDALKAKKARLAELEKKLGTMTPNEFAKRGHSAEAMRLENEIAALEAQQ